MDNKQFARTIIKLINQKIKVGESNPLAAHAPIVSKIVFQVFGNWNDRPADLDTDSFTVDEALIAIDDLLRHEEYEMETGLQYDNATSQILAVRDILHILNKRVRRAPERVKYV